MFNEKPAHLDTSAKIMSVSLAPLEKAWGLPPAYLTNLLAADTDWDFIVKMEVVLEGLIAEALEHELIRLSLKPGGRTTHATRLSDAKRIGLIDAAEFKMLIEIARLRNVFVHQRENLTRSLKDYLLELGVGRRREVVQSLLSAGVPGRIGMAKDSSATVSFTESIRQTMLSAVFPTLLRLGNKHTDHRREELHVAWRAEQERRYGEPLPPRLDIYLADRTMVMDLVSAKLSACVAP